MQVHVRKRLGRRRVGHAAVLFLAVAATLVIASPASAQLSGELHTSDLARPATPRNGEITVARKGADVALSFVVPKGYDAVHVRWSGPGRAETQEEYRIGGAPQDRVRTYTIHHVVAGLFQFKVQAVKKDDGFFGTDSSGPWVTKGFSVGRESPPKPPPPPPAPPPAPPPLKSPVRVVATRKNGTDVHVSWAVDDQANWYVVERRVAVAPLSNGPGSTPWAPACSPLKKGTGEFVAHYPVPPGKLKNIFRVIAYSNVVQAASAPVAEHTPKVARSSK